MSSTLREERYETRLEPTIPNSGSASSYFMQWLFSNVMFNLANRALAYMSWMNNDERKTWFNCHTLKAFKTLWLNSYTYMKFELNVREWHRMRFESAIRITLKYGSICLYIPHIQYIYKKVLLILSRNQSINFERCSHEMEKTMFNQNLRSIIEIKKIKYGQFANVYNLLDVNWKIFQICI